MRILLIYIILFFLQELSHSQNIRISEPINVRNDNFFDVLPQMNGNFQIFRQKSDKILINSFDSDLKYIGEKQIEFEEKKIDVVNVTFDENNWTIIYSFNIKGDKYFRARKYDFKGNLVDSIDIFSVNSSFLDKDYKIVNSENKSKTLLFRPNSKNEIECVMIDVFNLKLMFLKNFKIEDVNVNFDFRNIEISDSGNIFILFQKSSGLFKKLKNNIFIYSYESVSNITGNRILNLEFEFENYKFKYDNINNNIIIGGIINKAYSNKSNAYFTIKLNEKLDLLLIRKNNYSSQLLKKYYQASNIKPKDYFNSLIMRDILLRNDGGIILLFEEKEVYTRNTNIYGRNRMSDPPEYQDLIFGNIILISVHENGDEFWSNSIPKNQNSIRLC